MAAVIEVKNIVKAFGRVRALRGVSFTAEDGRITGLLGPNGAGKTTLLRILYALLRPDSGSVHVDGIDALLEPLVARQSLGVLPDARGLYKRLTARENIEYFGRLHGMAEQSLAESTRELITTLSLEAVAERRTEGFSQGERVKAAIARALVHKPRNVILDEPTNGLDVMTTRALRGFLQGLREQGRAVLFSSHIMQEVAVLCDTIVIIAEGRVVAAGSPDELRESTGCPNLEDAFVRLLDTAEELA